jgi:hypothetical protein
MNSPTSPHRLTPWLGAALALHCAIAFAVPTTEPLDIDPDMAADIAKQKARANSMKDARLKQQSGDKNAADPTQECGSVNIGNLVADRRIGFAPVDINVVVLGDILNINNKCK